MRVRTATQREADQPHQAIVPVGASATVMREVTLTRPAPRLTAGALTHLWRSDVILGRWREPVSWNSCTSAYRIAPF